MIVLNNVKGLYTVDSNISNEVLLYQIRYFQIYILYLPHFCVIIGICSCALTI